MKITVKAPAKINLVLDVVGRRADGYHLLETVFQAVDWYDRITVESAEQMRFLCSGSAPQDERNTAYRAAVLFNERIGCTDAYHITVDKQIPMQAGLAGGSADAAGVLVALNRLRGEPLSVAELCEIGAKIGADVPFCVVGGTVLATGIGEQLRSLPPWTQGYVVIAKPTDGVSTPEAYRRLDAAQNLPHPSADACCKAIESGNREALACSVGNVFETALAIPSCLSLKEQLLQHGAAAACMSGSGSAVFGLFYEKVPAEQCAEQLQVETVRVCRPCGGVIVE